VWGERCFLTKNYFHIDIVMDGHSVDRTKYQIQIPLPPKIDASVTMMQVEEKPDVTYSDVGGCKEQIEKLREVVETPLLSVRISLPFHKCLTKPYSSA
jgi:ATP-dependent 26S proteasome regulatory subunit